MTLAVYSKDRRIGRIELAGGELTGSSPGLRDMADAAVRKAGGDAAKAYRDLIGFTNGYVSVIPAPEPAPATRFDPKQPRGPHTGKWVKGGGGAHYPGQPWPVNARNPAGGDGKAGSAVTIDDLVEAWKQAGDRDIIGSLMKATAASHRGDIDAEIGHLRTAARLAKDLGHDSDAERYLAMAATLRTPEQVGFKGPLASKVLLGGDPAKWQLVAASLERIPPDLQQRMAKVVNTVKIEDHIDIGNLFEGGEAPPGFKILGMWTKNMPSRTDTPGQLDVATEERADHVILHEGMHALDEASGLPSHGPDWQTLASRVRVQMKGKIGTEYQADFRGMTVAGEELWAEMAAQVLEGKRYLNVNPFRKTEGGGVGALGPDLAAEVRKQLASQGVKLRE